MLYYLSVRIGLICLLVNIGAVRIQSLCVENNFGRPDCRSRLQCYECTISNQTDFEHIPSDANVIRLLFSSGSNIVLTRGLPARDRLLEVEMSVSNLASPSIAGNFFSSLSQLKTLTISHQTHSSVNFSLQLVNESFAGLTNLTRLNLPQLGIANLPVGLFKDLRSLWFLDLSQNLLKTIKRGTFDHQQELIVLFLGRNRISTLKDVSFDGLMSLKTMDLYGNGLQRLGQELSFLPLGNLIEINLDSNQMTSIEPNAFTGLKKLNLLYLGNNNLTNLTMNTFNDLSSLTTLNLKRNSLKNLPARIFSALGALQYLSLSDNDLDTVVSNTFANLHQLQDLELDSNKIQVVEEGGFDGLENLQALNLTNNLISQIESITFRSLRQIRSLYLKKNLLESLDVGFLEGFEKLFLLDLSLNPWNCSCKNFWIAAWLELYNLTHILMNEAETGCQSPEDRQNQTLLSAYFANHSCLYPFTSTTATSFQSESLAYEEPTGDGSLSVGVQAAIITVVVLVAIVIIIAVVATVRCWLRRIGFWSREQSESNYSLQQGLSKSQGTLNAKSDQSLFEMSSGQQHVNCGFVNSKTILSDG